mgnify:FL=1
MKYLKAFVLSIFAGLAIGLGSLVYTVVSAYFTSRGGMMFASALFSIGLILVCVFSLQLYTGKIGMVFDDKNKIGENLVNLPIILFGNAVGAFALGIICHFMFMSIPEITDRILVRSL